MAQASRPTVVAVFDVEDATGRFDEGTRRQLGDYLSAQLARVPGIAVVPRDQLRQLLLETKADSYRPCFEQACQIELGKAVSAQKSLAAKLLGLGGTCALTAVLFDLKTETTERAASTRTACRDEALFAALDDLVEELAGTKVAPESRHLPARATASPTPAPELSAPEPTREPTPTEPTLELTLDESSPGSTPEGATRRAREPQAIQPEPPPPLEVRWTSRYGHRILVLPEPILFGLDRDDLDASARHTLSALALALGRDPRLARERLEIAGHADPRERGKVELSERRARSVRAYLIERGVSIAQLVLVAAGDTEPLVTQGSDEARAKNRRVEVQKSSDD